MESAADAIAALHLIDALQPGPIGHSARKHIIDRADVTDVAVQADDDEEDLAGVPTLEEATQDPRAFALRYWDSMVRDQNTGNIVPFSAAQDEFYEKFASLQPGDRYAIAWPREHGKSTTAQICCAWALATGREAFIVWFGPNQSEYKSRLEDIRHLFGECPRLLRDFGLRVERDTADELLLSNGCRIVGRGWTGSKRGTKKGSDRPTLVILDDIEKDENINSADQRTKNENRLRRSVSNLGKYAKIIFIGTILHYHSLLAIRTKASLAEAEGIQPWDGKRLRAAVDLDAGTGILWEASWTAEDLRRKKAEIGSIAFNCEFQNEPSEDESWFLPSWFQWFDINNTPLTEKDADGTERQVFTFYGYCDPAISKRETADYTAIAVVGVHNVTGKRYVFQVVRERLGLQETVDNILALHARYGFQSFGVEQVAYQAALREHLVNESEKRRVGIPVRGIKVDGDNVRRIKRLSPFVENGTLMFERHLMQHPLYDELTQFPHAAHDDAPVAVEGAERLAVRDGSLAGAI